jgi:hypothetical protein
VIRKVHIDAMIHMGEDENSDQLHGENLSENKDTLHVGTHKSRGGMKL